MCGYRNIIPFVSYLHPLKNMRWTEFLSQLKTSITIFTKQNIPKYSLWKCTSHMDVHTVVWGGLCLDLWVHSTYSSPTPGFESLLSGSLIDASHLFIAPRCSCLFARANWSCSPNSLVFKDRTTSTLQCKNHYHSFGHYYIPIQPWTWAWD